MRRLAVQTFILLSLFLPGCTSTEKCPEGINLLPMFGGETKCEEQLKDDKKFISECDSRFEDRKIAAKYHVDKGWEYFYKTDYETSMKRFNQAWLLDSSNADVYWGFGNLLGIKHEFRKSLPLLEKSIKLNPNNPKIYECIATSYGQLFFEAKDVGLLNKTIDNLKTSIQLDPKSASAFGQLTGAYSYFTQKDSARKYLALTDKLDPQAINPEVRKMLTEN
jgi:tetratricopeptide (TPR) repeat protein